MIIKPYINNDDRIDQGIRPKPFIETIHHQVPKSRMGSNIEENKVKLYDAMHTSFHKLFGNLIFHEQVQQLLKINQTSLEEDYIHDLDKRLMKNSGRQFKNGIILRK